MPLVPEPFLKFSKSRVPVFFGYKPRAKFCPNLNRAQYLATLSDDKKTELQKRAVYLLKRACCNKIYSSSEFCWEVSAWNDVFGPLYEDDRVQMSVIDPLVTDGKVTTY